MTTYYSEYSQEATSTYFTSSETEVHTDYFCSNNGDESGYRRAELKDYISVGIKKENDYEFHAMGVSGGQGYPLSYKESDQRLTTKLSDRKYNSLTREVFDTQIGAHYRAACTIRNSNRYVIFAADSNKPEGYIWDAQSNRLENNPISYSSNHAPSKVHGASIDGTKNIFVFYDEGGTVLFETPVQTYDESSSGT